MRNIDLEDFVLKVNARREVGTTLAMEDSRSLATFAGARVLKKQTKFERANPQCDGCVIRRASYIFCHPRIGEAKPLDSISAYLRFAHRKSGARSKIGGWRSIALRVHGQ